MKIQVASVILLASLGRGAFALQADIRADTDRDGRVDIQGTTDVEGKQTWTASRGAIFLTNIWEPSGRCPTDHDWGSKFSDLATMERVGDCYMTNATDQVQRSPEHMARMLTVPIADASNAAVGAVSVSNDAARSRVRIFRARGDGWEMVNADTIFSAEELKGGLSLGIDAVDTRRPGVWDGKATVTFTVTDGEQRSEDSVMLRVAPLLTHHHLQRIEEVYATEIRVKDVRTLTNAVEAICAEVGIKTPLARIPTDDAWTQDIFETLYMSMPGPGGKAITKQFVFDVAHIRYGYSKASRPVWDFFRSRGVAMAHYHWPSGTRPNLGTIEALGNLLTIPPYEHDGKKFPAGRIIAGGTAGNRTETPWFFNFFAAQESQEPLLLDSTWLQTKHVDEFVQFLPAKTERGWRLMVNDPLASIKLLEDVQANKGGRELVASHPKVLRKTTVDKFLGQVVNRWVAGNASERIQGVIEVLKSETGITDDEILRVPVLYGSRSKVEDDIAGKPFRRRTKRNRRQQDPHGLLTPWEAAESEPSPKDVSKEQDTTPDGQGEHKKRWSRTWKPMIFPVDAYLPNAINGLPVSDSVYISPKPFGPVVGGRDVLEDAIRDVYKRAGFEVRFVDDWILHQFAGDIHCGTNTRREITNAWW